MSMDKNYAGNAYGVTAVLMAALSAALYKVRYYTIKYYIYYKI